jgi:hypothetical protein
MPRPGNVINLMDALRRSLGPEKSTQLKAKKSRSAATKPKPGRRTAARSKIQARAASKRQADAGFQSARSL